MRTMSTVFVKLPEGANPYHQSDRSYQSHLINRINLRSKIRQQNQNNLKPRYCGSKDRQDPVTPVLTS